MRVTAVVVAWNREHLVGDVLAGLKAQTRPPQRVIVVDNASTDSTPRILAATSGLDVVTMPRNVGGAGGFAAGIARAMALGTDLVWLMDDDTVPTPGALEALLHARDAYPGTPALLAARADWVDGREHPMNRPRYRPGLARTQRRHAAAIGARPVRTSSFVAPLIDARAIAEDGLPRAAFFLWNDDFEYTGRLLRRRVGLYVPAARVEHRTRVFGNSSADPGERFFNEVRNKVWTFTRCGAFGPLETVAFAGKTALRWARLLLTSPDRAGHVRRLARGLAAGVRPLPTTLEVLADTPVVADVAALEGAARG